MQHGYYLSDIFYDFIIGRYSRIMFLNMVFSMRLFFHMYSLSSSQLPPKGHGYTHINTDIGTQHNTHTFCTSYSELVMIQWEHTGELSRSGSDTILNKRAYRKGSTPEYSPAKLLLNGVGWSIPQSQGTRGAKNLMSPKRFDALHQSPTEMHAATSNFKYDPWFWFPSPAASWDGLDYLGRAGGVKDEHPWKIRASVIHSVRAHPGALRYLAVCPDESTVFTAGIGAGFKGTVQKWELTRINCVSGYYGHEEVCLCYSFHLFFFLPEAIFLHLN